MNKRVRLLGCPLDLLSQAQLLDRVAQAVDDGKRLRIEGLNVAKLVDARCDDALLSALEEAEVVHVDGMGISLGLACLGRRAAERVAGIDLMQTLCADAARRGASVYLLGARPEVVAQAAVQLREAHPGLQISGARDGYFAVEDEPEVVADIRASGAELLFIGISSPKKERFLREHWQALGVSIGMGVGGSFDVISGLLPRAPLWMQRCGLEWLFRLLLEPRRLAGRYLRTNLVFFWLLLRARLRRSNGLVGESLQP